MLSQSHDANSITYWLRSWSSDKKLPNEVVIDASEALILASIQTFTEYTTTNTYLSACMKALLGNDKPPRCLVRLDRSHFVAAVQRNKVLRKMDSRVGRLIKGIIGYLIQCVSFEICRLILLKLFTLINNEYVNDDVNSAKAYLRHIIKIFAVNEDEFSAEPDTEFHGENYFEETHGDSYKDTLVYAWITGLFDSIEVHPPSGAMLVENIFYSDKLKPYVMRLFTRLPMWTNIMCEVCESDNLNPTSSGSESEFNKIKRLIGIRTKRVDVFVAQHLKHLSGNMKMDLGQQKYSDTQTSKQISEKRKKRPSSVTEFNEQDKSSSLQRSKSLYDVSDLDLANIEKVEHKNPQENWRNQNKRSPLLRRSQLSFLNPHDVDYKYNSVPLVRNGYTATRRIRSKIVTVRNTCGFDSAFSIYAAAFCDNGTFHEVVDRFGGKEINLPFIVKTSIQKSGKKTDKMLYENRTKLLFKLYSTSYKEQIDETDNTIGISCVTAFGPLLQRLLIWDNAGEILSSVSIKQTCNQCHVDRLDNRSLMNVRFHGKINLKRLSKYIVSDDLNAAYCRKCNNQLILSKQYGNILAFDVEPLEEKYRYKIKISDIQHNSCIGEQTYKLFGVVEYIPDILHFIAHVERDNGIWETYDDLNSKVIRSKKCLSTPMTVFGIFYIRVID